MLSWWHPGFLSSSTLLYTQSREMTTFKWIHEHGIIQQVGIGKSKLGRKWRGEKNPKQNVCFFSSCLMLLCFRSSASFSTSGTAIHSNLWLPLCCKHLQRLCHIDFLHSLHSLMYVSFDVCCIFDLRFDVILWWCHPEYNELLVQRVNFTAVNDGGHYNKEKN